MKITILAVGHLKEAYWRAAYQEYSKRLSAYCHLELIEVDDLPTPEHASLAEEKQIKDKEGQRLLAKTSSSDFVVLLDLHSSIPDSLTLASKMENWMRIGGAKITFVIGGSLGLSEEVKKRGNATLTLSNLTFTHQMTRIILLEQIYRSFKINNHEPYNK